MSESLLLNEKEFSFNKIKEGNFAAQTPFEKSTLEFCQRWLNGEKKFELQTSGSTGVPKKIILSRNAMEASAWQTVNALKLKTGYTSLVCLDTKYIAGQMMLVRSLVLGMNIVAVEPSGNPLENINEQIDFVALVPLQLENIVNHSLEKFNHIRCAIIGGTAVSNSLKSQISDLIPITIGTQIYATYAMTETLSNIALQKLNGENEQDYFEAFEKINLRLDSRGCLCINADYLSEEVITNDLVELIDNKKFKWLGRIDNIINSGGIKIIPEKIETVIEKVFDSLQIKNRFFIAGLPNEKLGQHISLILEGESMNNTLQEKIIEEIKKQLTKYELPKEFLFVEKFIETNTGKINRKETIHLLQK